MNPRRAPGAGELLSIGALDLLVAISTRFPDDALGEEARLGAAEIAVEQRQRLRRNRRGGTARTGSVHGRAIERFHQALITARARLEQQRALAEAKKA